jgi:hypothetical protein
MLSKRKKRIPNESKAGDTKPASTRDLLVERGFDFGVELRVLLASTMDFVTLLQRAEIIGCAYGYLSNGPLGPPMLEVALIGLHAGPLAEAFVEFTRWANSAGRKDDGDTVGLDFIFLKSGGYVLSIGRESTRATTDLRGPDRTHSPILMGGSYNKQFDTRNLAIEKLRESKCQLLIDPFLFSAATLPSRQGAIPRVDTIRPITNVERLLKFEATFSDEETLEPGSYQHSILAVAQKSMTTAHKKRTDYPTSTREPADFFRHRKDMLKRHFPVTLERLRSGQLFEIIEELTKQGIKKWQVEQAACNLLLSASLCQNRLFYSGLKSEEFTTAIAKGIQERWERSDTPNPGQFSVDQFVSQIRLDAKALLDSEGQKTRSSSLSDLQEKLAELNLLEPCDA